MNELKKIKLENIKNWIIEFQLFVIVGIVISISAILWFVCHKSNTNKQENHKHVKKDLSKSKKEIVQKEKNSSYNELKKEIESLEKFEENVLYNPRLGELYTVKQSNDDIYDDFDECEYEDEDEDEDIALLEDLCRMYERNEF